MLPVIMRRSTVAVALIVLLLCNHVSSASFRLPPQTRNLKKVKQQLKAVIGSHSHGSTSAAIPGVPGILPPLLIFLALIAGLELALLATKITGVYNCTLLAPLKNNGNPAGVFGFVLYTTEYHDLNVGMFAIYNGQYGLPSRLNIYNVSETSRRINTTESPALLNLSPGWTNATNAMGIALALFQDRHPWIGSLFQPSQYYAASQVWLRAQLNDASDGQTLYDILNGIYKSPNDAAAGVFSADGQNLTAEGRFTII